MLTRPRRSRMLARFVKAARATDAQFVNAAVTDMREAPNAECSCVHWAEHTEHWKRRGCSCARRASQASQTYVRWKIRSPCLGHRRKRKALCPAQRQLGDLRSPGRSQQGERW